MSKSTLIHVTSVSNKSKTVRAEISTERNKRCIRIPQNFLKVNNAATVRKNANKTGILYKHSRGYMLFELDDTNRPLKIWRDDPIGKFPLPTAYAHSSSFVRKLLECKTRVVYTNDAKPLMPLFAAATAAAVTSPDEQIKVCPFFVPITELLDTLVRDLQTLTPETTTTSVSEDTVPAASVRTTGGSKIPAYSEIRSLDPSISYKDYMNIYHITTTVKQKK